MSRVYRIFAEKKPGFDVEAGAVFPDLKENLGISGLQRVRILHRYDVEGITGEEYLGARWVVFGEPTVDLLREETFLPPLGSRVLAVEYLPGQYDQRADSAAQCLQILSHRERPEVRSARLLVLEGDISDADFRKIKEYCINPVESRQAGEEKPRTLETRVEPPSEVEILHGFTEAGGEALERMHRRLGLAMSLEDLEFCRGYFCREEKRDPTLTEIRVLDTYWSDHCRHTTFLSRISEVDIEPGPFASLLESALGQVREAQKRISPEDSGELSLMRIATLAMKEMRRDGLLEDVDLSAEVNACCIRVEAEVDGRKEPWLVLFKNETHNHPTEIEPFGGAATCLGGAIRDPLSGRAYVYQAMRVTGSGDPRVPVSETLPGKLPQSTITRGAAAGFSSYGNQIGLATGQVVELYDPGYIAKRMEIGAVLGAAPAQNVVRSEPEPGDRVILLGGRTGRDGCGGATGSSKAHTEESLLTCGAEVQKGNPPTERKLQRLFRKPQVSRMIKRCNDFGAGGVSVALGELADGLEIDLSAVPRKYEGLDGTELAISESQERMAVVIAPGNLRDFLAAAAEENLEATAVAQITAEPRLKMRWQDRPIVDLSRAFLNTNGVQQTARVRIRAPRPEESYFRGGAGISPHGSAAELKAAWLANLSRLLTCCQKGLAERFDSTIGAGTILLPFGGSRQWTPEEGMAARIPVLEGETDTATLMSFGYNPVLARWSPFHGAVYAIVEAVAKTVAMGGSHRGIRLSLQEYFEKPGKNPDAWGKPFAALLGAYHAQKELGIAAIGGKDSMSGTFQELVVPPTLVAFAVSSVRAGRVHSAEFKEAGSRVICVPLVRDAQDMPRWESLHRSYDRVHALMAEGRIRSARSVRHGGIAEAVSTMCFGNWVGFSFDSSFPAEELFRPDYGFLLLEVAPSFDPASMAGGLLWREVGMTVAEPVLRFGDMKICLEEALQCWRAPLEKVFPVEAPAEGPPPQAYCYPQEKVRRAGIRTVHPQVFMPVFPGTNCEVDTERAFRRAGGRVRTAVFRNLHPPEIEESLAEMVRQIRQAQILVLPGGFSAGDEPEGSGKFIGAVFRNPAVREAVGHLLQERDGLILGICNGFQALVKLGLLPYGEIRDLGPEDPTLTYNRIGRHVSCMVRTRIASTLSPWLGKRRVGDIHIIPVSHGEGRFAANPEWLERLAARGQIATQYVDLQGVPTCEGLFNPNGSAGAVEGITSPDGRVFGKMGHSERIGPYVASNVPGEKDQQIFEAGIEYFL